MNIVFLPHHTHTHTHTGTTAITHCVNVNLWSLHSAPHSQLDDFAPLDGHLDTSVELENGLRRQRHPDLCIASYRDHSMHRRHRETREWVWIKDLSRKEKRKIKHTEFNDT